MKLKTLWPILFVTACSHTPSIDIEAETAALLAADQAFADLSEASNSRNAFAAFLAPDGMMLPRGSEGAIEGYENAMALFGNNPDPNRQLLWQPQFAEVSRGGDMGWTWGQYQSLNNGEIVNTGKYLNVWKRQADGSWKVRVDVGNQRPDNN